MIASDTIVEPSVSGVSWPAVAAGAVASGAITLMLLSLGVGLGLSVVSPWGPSAASVTTFKLGTGIYFIVIAMLSSAIGGWLAGRLRTKWVGIHQNEVYFRDTAHGFLAWAFATLIGAILLSSVAGGIIGSATQGLSLAAGSAAANSSSSGPMDSYVDSLLRSDTPATAPNGGNSNPRPELTRLLTAGVRNGGDVSASDRTYIANVVSARTGLSQPDAQKRVDDVITKAKSDLDQARSAALQMSLWLVASLLIGAFSASLAATEGGEIRDRNWRTAV